MKLFVYFLLAYCCCQFCFVVNAHLLPDELLTDDAEILEREKRDGFFNRLFSLFKNNDEEEEEKENAEVFHEDQENNFMQDVPLPSFGINFVDMNTPALSSERSTVSTSPILSLQTSTQDISSSPSISGMISTLPLKSTPMLTTSPTVIAMSSIMTTQILSSNISVSSTVSSGASILSTLSSTIQPTAATHISAPMSTISSPSTSTNFIQPTPSKSLSSTSVKEEMVGMQMLLAAPRLPDEQGYGNVLAQEQKNKQDEAEVKSIQFVLSNLLIPVMSGLFGALCVTVVILVIKCVRRRRMRQVRYYGGKPESTLYGLDHMGLLSDMSSDEE